MPFTKNPAQKVIRTDSSCFKYFGYYFRKYVSKEEPKSEYELTDKEACEKYSNLNKKIKIKIFKQMAGEMKLSHQQVQKHYANKYKKCIYPHILDELSKQFITYFVYDSLIVQQQSEKKLQTRVKELLQYEDFNIFPGDVDAWISAVKKRILNGRIKKQTIPSLDELRKRKDDKNNNQGTFSDLNQEQYSSYSGSTYDNINQSFFEL